ncbi:hypothetical protein WA026_006528 [Henosepilachna vigintioctopunctata]|uniref:LIM zinc-binding domain-containing protein n=1 Tax=Henosepilachna vigintioctopunctata TaxID=420089 RepID=A0AAW1UFY5_9CUCU
MNPHYHSYGGTELTSPPHPPSPDNYHGHPVQPGGGPHHNRMHPSNGHAINTLGVNPHHDQHQHPHPHHPHSGFGGGGPPQEEHMQMHNPTISNTNNNNNTVRICAGCGGKIMERFLLHALDRYWHNSCLKCSCCAAMLADLGTSCFTRSGMILCKQDYMR